jgi:hypothetical protein
LKWQWPKQHDEREGRQWPLQGLLFSTFPR